MECSRFKLEKEIEGILGKGAERAVAKETARIQLRIKECEKVEGIIDKAIEESLPPEYKGRARERLRKKVRNRIKVEYGKHKIKIN